MACPCPYPPEILVKDAELRELGHLLTSNLSYDHGPVIFNMGGDGPVRGRVRWQTRRARRAQCATALALATLAVLVAVGTLVADGESAPTDAGTCSGARADVTATISNIGRVRFLDDGNGVVVLTLRHSDTLQEACNREVVLNLVRR